MCCCQSFHRICNQLSGCQRVMHSFMSHYKAITDSNRRNYDRCSSGRIYSRFYSFCQSVQVYMSRNDLTMCGNYSNQWFPDFFLCKSCGIEQRSLRCTFHSGFHNITIHNLILLLLSIIFIRPFNCMNQIDNQRIIGNRNAI